VNFWTYLGVDEATFAQKYLDTRLVQRQQHPTFPLSIYTYGRETVHDSHWDEVTMKCRGIVVNHETWEIVARPFEKFFNFGSTEVPGLTSEDVEAMDKQPVIWEKVDGFLCIAYQWNGRWYIASKGSFTSPHAKWASAQCRTDWKWPLGYTPVFEGVCSSLRIVVDYGTNQELVLLALIDKETGAELNPVSLKIWADENDISLPELEKISWQEAYQNSYDETLTNAEGYVLTWYRPNSPPFRLKMKFADYLRLHRMVTGVSPKRILEVLQNGWTSEMDGLLNESTPWFNKFVARWKRVIEGEFARIETASLAAYADAKEANRIKVGQRHYENMGAERKAWAHEFTRLPNKEFSGVLFAMLDGKDHESVIWKMIRNSPLLKGGKPMVDRHSL
jgi:RNA ligase